MSGNRRLGKLLIYRRGTTVPEQMALDTNRGLRVLAYIIRYLDDISGINYGCVPAINLGLITLPMLHK